MKLLCAITCIILSGCATKPVIEYVNVPVEVKVPVPTPCKPDWPTEPTLNVGRDELTGLYAKGVAVIKELEEQRAYAKLLKAALKACSDPAVTPK